MELNGKKILFLGDSITEGCGASGSEKTFCSIIAHKYGACCVNYGIGGTRIARQSKPSAEERWDKDFCSRVSAMQNGADAVVVFGGTNDYGHGDAPIGSMNDRTPDTFYGALHTLYSSLIEKYIGAPIVVITPLHRINENSPLGDGYKETAVGPLSFFVKIIREVAEYYSLPLAGTNCSTRALKFIFLIRGAQKFIFIQKSRSFELSCRVKTDKCENDFYRDMPIEKYLTLAFMRACRVAVLIQE